MNFTELHHQNQPLIIANVWDAVSAITADQLGYKALGTSSAAIAAMLGYDDGEAMSFEELFYIVSRIRSVTDLPLSVDIEAGFGGSVEEISAHLKRLAHLGVVGVNLEDSCVVNGVRQLGDPNAFAFKLKEIRKLLVSANCHLFLNIRTDTYLLDHQQALRETLLRGQLYEAAGADGIFIPCLTSENDIAVITKALNLPLNIMCMPELPTFSKLETLGVKRISMGSFVHSSVQSKLEALMSAIQTDRSFAGLFADESY
jgi:2-methylisocitrate lyase-like PEP mutase family enzyme